MRHHLAAVSTAICVLAAAAQSRAGESAPAKPRPVRTLDDMFEVFQMGKPWPQQVDLGTALHKFLEDGPEPNRAGGANQLSGSVEGFEVGVFSDATNGTVKALFARLEDAFDAGDATQAKPLSDRLEAVFQRLAAARACQVQSSVEQASTVKGKTVRRRFEVRRLHCDDGKVTLDYFVDQGEREYSKTGKVMTARAGQLGLDVRASGEAGRSSK
jgi:hypothetical protein